MTRAFRRVLPFGAELIAPDRTRFRLWAPSLERLDLVIEGRDDIAMTRAADGWFEREIDCGAGTRYRFTVNAVNVVGTSPAGVSPAVTTQTAPPPQTTPA